MRGHKILFATDYSSPSKLALQYATWLAKCTGARIYIVHVSEHEQYPVGEHFNEVPAPNPRELGQLQSVRPDDSTVQIEHQLLYGEPGSTEVTNPAKVIVDFADKKHVDMIVLGTHGRTGLGRLLIGSVAESVLRNAHCPVVTVRQRRD